MAIVSDDRRVLVLGGTRWLGGAIAARHVASGAEVVCLARGASGAVPDGAHLVVGDRDHEGAYDALEGEWDEVGGPGDESDRFGYWVGRLALAGDGPVLVPARDRPTQTIDVRDLAAFIVDVAASRRDVVNAVGAEMTLHALIALARELAGHTGELVLASDAELASLEIGYWAGPRALPLTLPAALASHAQRSSARYRAAGGAHRSLRETLEAALADERRRGLERASEARLSRADELAAIDSLASMA